MMPRALFSPMAITRLLFRQPIDISPLMLLPC